MILVLTGCGKKSSTTSSNGGQDGSTQTEVTTEQEVVVPAENLVLVQNGKFSPATITVKKGTEVTWVNKDPEPCWIASDPHPIHTGLAGFDAGKGIKQDGTFKFTFQKTGTFGYHDHLNISSTGKVVVEP